MQTPAIGQMIGDVGAHGVDRGEGIRRPAPSPQSASAPISTRGRVMIGRAAQHDAVKPLIQKALRLVQRGDAAIDANGQIAGSAVSSQRPAGNPAAESRGFPWGERPCSQALRAWMMKWRHPCRCDRFEETRQHLLGVLIIDADAAFHRHRAPGFAPCIAATQSATNCGPFHQHRAKTARLHPVRRAADIQVDLVIAAWRWQFARLAASSAGSDPPSCRAIGCSSV